MGCGICGAFPNLAGMTTTMANIGIIYTSSPVIIIFLSILFFKEKINFFRIIGLLICITGVFTIISKGNLDFLINLNFTIGDLMGFRSSFRLGSLLNLFIKLEIKI